MRVLLHTEFAASRKEPLGAMFERVWTAFQEAGMGEPKVQFSFSDAPAHGGVSSVDRVLRRYPELQRFFAESSLGPPLPVARRITNKAAIGEPVNPEVLRAILAGVPRSFPFHNILLVFAAPAFGEGSYKSLLGEVSPGVILGDSWWVNGRTRSLSAFTFVEGEVRGKSLAALPDPVVALFSKIGKARKARQFPLPGENPAFPQAAKLEVLEAVRNVVTKYRARVPELLESVEFPHDLPPALEARQGAPFGEKTGPKKPVLVRAFGPMGYDCKAESATFTLRRRTPSNLTLEVSLDVGTWSRSLTAGFAVRGLGFCASVSLPVSRRAGAAQYPIGDGDQWQKLVDNLAVFVKELERSFVPAVETAAGPSPEWFTPEK